MTNKEQENQTFLTIWDEIICDHHDSIIETALSYTGHDCLPYRYQSSGAQSFQDTLMRDEIISPERTLSSTIEEPCTGIEDNFRGDIVMESDHMNDWPLEIEAEVQPGSDIEFLTQDTVMQDKDVGVEDTSSSWDPKYSQSNTVMGSAKVEDSTFETNTEGTKFPGQGDTIPALECLQKDKAPEAKHFRNHLKWSSDDCAHPLCMSCYRSSGTATCQEKDCPVTLCVNPEGRTPCSVQRGTTPWLCPAHAGNAACEFENLPKSVIPRHNDFQLRPLLSITIRFKADEPINLSEMTSFLDNVFDGHPDLLMKHEVEVDVSKSHNMEEDKETEVECWMKKHPCPTVIIFLLVNGPAFFDEANFNVVKYALGRSYKSILPNNSSPIRGLLVIGLGGRASCLKIPSNLKGWRESVRKSVFNLQSLKYFLFNPYLSRTKLTWVVGFTNPGLDLCHITSFIPVFIFQAYFKTLTGGPNAVLYALIHSYNSVSVSEHSRVLLVEISSPSSIHATVKEFSKSIETTP
ncbi:hypothetical protein CVT25_006701 [Psilocybe cyanescens]|uniref:Uncharacterized protein n=1 Tax=Psilocybe cyanescens TaxID=93625 RepID=A0A409X4A0_PSICY|nr:hypothetical protein CVT25_006701 [Psilocybe cyanescens]